MHLVWAENYCLPDCSGFVLVTSQRVDRAHNKAVAGAIHLQGYYLIILRCLRINSEQMDMHVVWRKYRKFSHS